MLSRTSESKMRLVRASLAVGWVLLIASLFYDPISPNFTSADSAGPFHLPSNPIEVQGVPIPEQPYSMGPRLFWSIIVPIIPLFLLVFGHEAWRRVCPLSFFSQIPRYLGVQRRRKVFSRRSGKVESTLNLIRPDSWVRRHPLFIPFGLLFLGVNLRIVFINSDRMALALFFIIVIVAAIVIGYFWGGKTWCNYICPLSVVQKIYTEPRGLLESQAHLEKQPISQSMCRQTTPGGERSICVGCTTCCPDIDLERSYWENIKNPSRRFVYYGYLGLVLGFYWYYYLYSGNWSYYFSGAWTHEETQLSQLWNPGLYLRETAVPLPKIFAAPLVILLFILLAWALGYALERVYIWIRRSAGKLPAETDLLNQCFAVSTFVTINVFYLFGGRPNLRLLPDLAQTFFDGGVVFLSTLWLIRALRRSAHAYNKESLVSSLLKQLKKLQFNFTKILEGRSLDDLKTDEVYILARTLPGFTRDQKHSVYKNVLQEALATGKTDSSQSLATLRDLRLQVGLSEEEHNGIMNELGIEDAQLLDPDKKMTVENWIRQNNYKESLERIIKKGIADGVRPERLLERNETTEELALLRSYYHISESEHEQYLARLLGGQKVFLDQASSILGSLRELASRNYALRCQVANPESPVLRLFCKLIALRREEYAAHLRDIVVSLGDSPEAVILAQKLFLLTEDMQDGRTPVSSQGDGGARRVCPKVADALTRKLGSTELPGVELSIDCSYADIVLHAKDPVAILEAMTDDRDPMARVLALATLAETNAPRAREKATQMRDDAVPEHWLLRETVNEVLGIKEKKDEDAADGLLELLVQYPDSEAVRYRFNKPSVTIGQARENDVLIFHPNVSLHHAIIRRNVNGVFVEDLSSVQRTIIGGATHSGRSVQIGEEDEMRFDASPSAGPTISVRWNEDREEAIGYRTEQSSTLTKVVWLADVEPFNYLELTRVADLARDAEVRVYTEGSVLCRLDDPSEEIFVIRAGTAEAIIRVDGQEKVAGEIPNGQLIGELGVITDRPRTATVRVTSEKAVVLTIKGSSIDGLLETDPRVSKSIIRMVYDYLQRASG